MFMIEINFGCMKIPLVKLEDLSGESFHQG